MNEKYKGKDYVYKQHTLPRSQLKDENFNSDPTREVVSKILLLCFLFKKGGTRIRIPEDSSDEMVQNQGCVAYLGKRESMELSALPKKRRINEFHRTHSELTFVKRWAVHLL